jgi:hypothetical protein
MAHLKKYLDALAEVSIILMHEKMIQMYKEIQELESQLSNYFQIDDTNQYKLIELKAKYTEYIKIYNHLLTFKNG